MTDVAATPLHAGLARLLVVAPSWIGDTVMATPVLRALRAHLPDTTIAALLRPGLDEVLRGTPWLDETIVRPHGGWGGPLATGRSLRRGRFDAALLLPNSFRAALTTRIAGIPVRVGYARDARRLLLTHPVAPPPRNRPVPLCDYYGQLAATALGVEAIEGAPELAVTEEESAAAAAMLPDDGRPLVVLNPGANDPAKRWPAERFAAVGAALTRDRGVTIAVTGGAAERPVAAEVAAGIEAAIDLAAAGLTLGALKAVIARAGLLITNDSGPRHLAAALGTPSVVLYGPTDHRWTTLPDARERCLLGEPFLPEALTADRHPAMCRVDRITEGDVLAAAGSLLGDTSG